MRTLPRFDMCAMVRALALCSAALPGCAAGLDDVDGAEAEALAAAVQPIPTGAMVPNVALTNYYVPQERDLHGDGTRVTLAGIGTFYRRFVCQVAINGTGFSEGGRYLRRTDTDASRTCEAASFAFASGVLTATGATARTNRTIAVDPRRIPYGRSVFLESQCRWYRAEDRCGACVRDYTNARADHIDVFTGTVRSPSPPVGTPSTRVLVTTAPRAFADPPPTCGDNVCDPCDAAACPDDCRTPPPPPPPPPPTFGTGACGSTCNSILDCGIGLFCDASNTCAGYVPVVCPSAE